MLLPYFPVAEEAVGEQKQTQEGGSKSLCDVILQGENRWWENPLTIEEMSCH